GYGCETVDDRVKIPSSLVEVVLKNLKKSVEFKYKGKKLTLEKGTTLTHATGGMPFILDVNTNEQRQVCLEDLVDSIHVMNELDSLDLPCSYVSPADVPSKINQLVQCEHMFRYSKKPVYGLGVSSPSEAKYIAEIFNACKDEDGYNGLVGVSPESTLYIPKDISDTLKTMMEAEIPVSILTAPIAGISGPMTLVGSVTQMHAETIAMATLAYIYNPKTPVFYGSRVCFANMRNGNAVWGIPDMGLAGGLASQLARYSGFMSDVYGLSTASCCFDEQTGFEKAINTLIPALGGASLISGFGSLASVMLASLTQLVIDDEIFSSVKHALKPIEVNKDTIALEIVEKIVNGGNYISQKHTVKHLRAKEIHTPNVAFSSTYNEWSKLGRKQIDEVAKERLFEIMKKERVQVISEESSKELDKILKLASENLL
ncbi:MAG: trimethylamine methyltransferase family protein, partial [Peptostreptococcaceae bacterium]